MKLFLLYHDGHIKCVKARVSVLAFLTLMDKHLSVCIVSVFIVYTDSGYVYLAICMHLLEDPINTRDILSCAHLEIRYREYRRSKQKFEGGKSMDI